MKTRGGWRETPQSHEIAVKPTNEMTGAELEARIRELDVQVQPPMVDLKTTVKSSELPSVSCRVTGNNRLRNKGERRPFKRRGKP